MSNTTEKRVVLKPIESYTWSGFHRYPKCKDAIIADLGPGGYKTGLSEKEATELEKSLLMQPGTLSPHSKYWRDFAVHIGDKDEIYDISAPLHQLDVAILKASKRVANSLEELTQGKWPGAEYYLSNAEEEAQTANEDVVLRKKASKIYVNMNFSEMRKFLKLIGRKSDSMSDVAVDNAVDEIVQSDPEMFINLVNEENFEERVFIMTCVGLNILRERTGMYYYGDEMIGGTLQEAADFIKNPKNNDVVVALKKQVDAKEQK